MKNEKLLTFVQGMSRLLETGPAEPDIMREGGGLLATLVAQDDWLPAQFTVPHPQYYQQYLLYADPLDRFSMVSFVWGPGQKTPVHDHMTWGLIGMLRGKEIETHFHRHADGAMTQALRGLLAVAEAYPDLKASANFLSLQEELSTTENKVGFARQFYNDNVRSLNSAVKTFPSNLFANLAKVTSRAFYEVDDPSDRKAPNVKF